MHIKKLDKIRKLLDKLLEENARPLIVGGAVRDMLLNKEPKDIDVEVFCMEIEKLESILSQFGKVDLVGRCFGILKLKIEDEEFDFSIPRKEIKSREGHGGFKIELDREMTEKAAASRRDFTINALMFDPATTEVIDFFGGVRDLKDGILRHVSDAFSEDPLRVLRGMQFASRFNMEMAEETIELCKGLFKEAETLAKERIWMEWEKWALKSDKPSIGLEVLRKTGWIKMLPELEVLIGCPQDSEWHPEGDVWNHTLLVVDKAAEIAKRDGLVGNDRLAMIFSALFHDVGKASTTKICEEDGRIRSPRHDTVGAKISVGAMTKIGGSVQIIKRIEILISRHMVRFKKVTPRIIRRLSYKLAESDETIEMLVRLGEADKRDKGLPEGFAELLTVADDMELNNTFPQPILMGRHLLKLGLKPGPEIGEILKKAFEAQLDGEFENLKGAFKWFKHTLFSL